MKLAIIFLAVLLTLYGIWWSWGNNFDSSSQSVPAATTETKIGKSSVSLALGEFLIAKSSDGDLCAIKFNKMSDDNGAYYQTWYIPSAQVNNTFKNMKPYLGHVFEKYWRTRTGLNRYSVFSIGGEDKILCGDIKFSWSLSTWIYYLPNYQFAVLAVESIDEIDINSSEINWIKSNND